MANELPTADEAFGLPTADEAFGVSKQPPPASGPLYDRLIANTGVGRVLDAFGQGVSHGWGTKPLGLGPESEAALRKAGILPDIERSWLDGLKAFNESLIRPAAAAIDLAVRGTGSVYRGLQSAGVEAGLHRDIVSIPDAFMGSIGGKSTAAMDARKLYLAEELGITNPRAGRADVPQMRAPEGLDVPQMRAPEGVAPREPAPVPGFTSEKPIIAERPGDLIDKRDQGMVDHAGNFNLDFVSKDADVRDMLVEFAGKKDGFITDRRGVVPWKQTEELADMLGMTPEALLKRNVGEAFNATQLEGAARALTQSARELQELAAKPLKAEADLARYLELEARHALVQGAFSGAVAEAGRSLNIMRKARGAAAEAQAITNVIKEHGGAASIEERMRMVAMLDTPAQVSKFLADSRRATTSEMLTEFFVNSILSGVQTTGANIISNTLTAVDSLVSSVGAVGVGKVRQILGSEGERVTLGESKARLFGTLQAAPEAIELAAKAFLAQRPITDAAVAKVEMRNYAAIPTKTIRIPGAAYDLTVGGKQVRLPGAWLLAEDEFFKSVARRQETNALAYRQAVAEGLEGEARAARISDLIRNPTDDILEKARDFSLKQTFQTHLGTVGQALQQISNSGLPGKVVVTFVRAPINLMKYAADGTPLGLASREVRDNLSGARGKAAQDTEIARMVIGTSTMTLAAMLALDGRITGSGPSDPNERALWLRMNQPNSFISGGVAYGFNRLDPFAMRLGFAADMALFADRMTELEVEKLGILFFSSIRRQVLDKTWMQGLSNLNSAISDPQRFGDNYLERLLASFAVPNVAAQVARAEDPYLRDAQSIMDAIRVRVPGESTWVLPKRDIFGEPLKREGQAGPDIISPIPMKTVERDPVYRELARLKVFPAALDKNIRGVKLSPELYDDYQQISGRYTRLMLGQMMSAPAWLQVEDHIQRELVIRTIHATRQQATQLMLMRHPEIITGALDLQSRRFTGRPLDDMLRK